MEEALRTLLLGTASIGALVATRIDWGLRSQGAALPAIDMHLASWVPQMKLSGRAEWSRDRVQIDSWGRSFKAARDVAKLMGGDGGLLVGFRGIVGDIHLRTFVVDGRNDTDTDDIGPLFRSSLDVTVWHNP